MTTLIGFDNTDGKMEAIELNVGGGFVGCEAYDWAFDVSEDQITLIKQGKAADVILDNFGGSVDWFVPA